MNSEKQDRPTPTKFNRVPTNTDPDDSVSNAAIYARTSSSKPEFHYSIDEQVSRCWDHCKQQGWDVVFVFTDEAESGKNTDRPGFQDMLEKARKGCFDVVVFWKLDRFCRSLTDLVKTEEKFDEYDVALQSVTEYIDTASPVGRFNFRNLASAAELESDLTSQRVQIGVHGMAKEHRWPNSQPPLGYDLAEDQTLKTNDEEASLVSQIFQMYLEYRSMPKVAHELNNRGKTTKDGEDWSRWSVRKILANEIYRGKYQLGDYEDHVEEYRIIDDELFEDVTQTRYRFKHEKGEMDEDRKESKANKILGEFKSAKEERND
ncbi:MAG: recombinase family protein [Candidatus Nanohaloarchaea archaeon]